LWEWVQDWYGLEYFSNSPESDPKGPESGEYRILRGGSWRGVARGPARVSSRYILRPGVRSNVLGVRCVRATADWTWPAINGKGRQSQKRTLAFRLFASIRGPNPSINRAFFLQTLYKTFSFLFGSP